MQQRLEIAVVGAGPVGLALALHAARLLPHARITLFDARPLQQDVSADPRTLALSLGSVQWLRRLMPWPASAMPITEVHVSQQPPSFGHAEFGGVQPDGGGLVPQQGTDGDARRRLRHVHAPDRRRCRGLPRAQAFEQLHAAERQRQRARVGRDIAVDRTGIEDADARRGQAPRRKKGQCQPHRAGAHDRDLQRCHRPIM